MKCDECRALLQEYVETELEESLSGDIFAHLDACAGCTGACEELRREREAYRRYFSAVEPTPALWANFQKSLEKEKEGRSLSFSIQFHRVFVDAFQELLRRPIHTAAFVLVAIGIILALMEYRASRPEVHTAEGVIQIDEGNNRRLFPSPSYAENALAAEQGQVDVRAKRAGSDRAALQANSITDRYSAALTEVGRKHVKRVNHKLKTADAKSLLNDSVREAEQQYLAAIAALLRDSNRRRGHFDAGANTQVSQALADLDRTIIDTRRAVQNRPNDPLAVMYMTVAYKKKVEVLRQLTGS